VVGPIGPTLGDGMQERWAVNQWRDRGFVRQGFSASWPMTTRQTSSDGTAVAHRLGRENLWLERRASISVTDPG
jgi:hypothetical protein